MLKVRAIGDEGKVVGYYDHIRRRGGDEFVLKDISHFSTTYMEELDKEAFAAARKAAEAANKEDETVKSSLTASQVVDREEVKAKLNAMGVKFAANLSTDKLVALLAEAEEEGEE